MLLCLLLVAKSSVGAVLAFAEMPALGGPDFDPCPLVAPVEVAGSHGQGADEASPQTAAGDPLPAVNLPPHHHHSCSSHCLMPGLVAAPMSLTRASLDKASWPESAVPTSAVSSPLVHPPRSRG